MGVADNRDKDNIFMFFEMAFTNCTYLLELIIYWLINTVN